MNLGDEIGIAFSASAWLPRCTAATWRAMLLLRRGLPRAALDAATREVVARLDPSLDDERAAVHVAEDARAASGRGVEVDTVRELQRCANIIDGL